MIEHAVLAPCGIDCRLCIGYQRKKKPCPGCGGKHEDKPNHCQKCSILLCGERAAGDASDSGFCFACAKYPCRRLKQLDKRYREKYHLSILENLAFIKEKGEDAFLQHGNTRWKCALCGGLVCVHHTDCMHCGAEVDWTGR